MAKIDLYPLSGGLELDLRKEMDRFLFGASDEVQKGQLVIIRKMRRKDGVIFPASSSDLQECPCKTESLTQEPDKEYPCDICQGEGYLFDDEVVPGYKTNRFEYQDVEKYKAWGKNTVAMSFFYLQFEPDISRYDKVIEPLVDINGNLLSPVQVRQRHNVHMAERFRSDSGRTEYWRCACWTD